MPSDDEKSVVGSDAADENSDSDRGSGEEVYEVEKILKRRVVRNKNEYLVRWRGYTPSADTWEPEANLGGAKEAMKKFLETEDGKGGGSAKGKKRSSGGGGIGSSSSTSKSKKNTTTGAGSSKRMFDDEAAAADDSSGAEEGSDDDDFQPAKKLKKESDPAKRGRPAAGNKKKKAGGGKGAARKASPSGGSRSTVTPVPKPNFDSPLVRRSGRLGGSPPLQTLKPITIQTKPTPNQIKPNETKPNPITNGQAKALKTRTQLGINQRKLDWLNSDDSDNSNSKRDDSVDQVPPKEQKDKQEKMNGDLVQKVNAVKENSVGTVAGSPPPPVDPVGNNSRLSSQSIICHQRISQIDDKDEDLFSDHDEVDSANNKMAHMPGSGEKVNGLVKSDDNLSTAETARMNGTSSSASFRASTSTPVANNSGGSRKNEKASNSNSKAKVKTVEEQEDDEAEEKEEEEEEQGPRSTRRQPRHVAQTNNKKSCPQKLHINAMFRDGKGQLMMMANQGTSVGVTTTINGALERKLVLLLKEELKNGLDD